MIVQNIDADLPGNTEIPHRRQIPLQTTEFSSRGVENANWSETHFRSFSSLSSLWGVSTVQYNDSINIHVVHTATTQDFVRIVTTKWF